MNSDNSSSTISPLIGGRVLGFRVAGEVRVLFETLQDMIVDLAANGSHKPLTEREIRWLLKAHMQNADVQLVEDNAKAEIDVLHQVLLQRIDRKSAKVAPSTPKEARRRQTQKRKPADIKKDGKSIRLRNPGER